MDAEVFPYWEEAGISVVDWQRTLIMKETLLIRPSKGDCKLMHILENLLVDKEQPQWESRR